MSENIILVEVGAAPLPNTTPVVPVYRNWFPVPNTAAPIASPAVTIAPVANGLLLTWPSSIADAEYRIEGADDNSGSPGTWSLIGTTSDLRYTVTTASLATRWYRVTATLRGRVSSPSAAVQGTPISPAQLQQFNDLANDNLLTPDEKPRVIQDRDTINGERTGLEAQATSYGITAEKTTYSNAVDALTAYLATLTSPVLWSNISGNTTIVGTTLRQKFVDVAVARQALVNKFAAEAKRLLDDIVSDNIISRAEKLGEIVRWNEAVAALSSDQSKADAAGVSRTAYDAAYTALETHINGLSGFTNTTVDTPIVGATYRTKWGDYLTQRTLLLNAIADKARTMAAEANARGNGSNLVPSASFGPNDGWYDGWGETSATWTLNNAPGGLAPIGVNVYWTQPTGVQNGWLTSRDAPPFGIEGGKRYCWQARAWAQRANVGIGIICFDKDGNNVYESVVPYPLRGSEPASADAWKRVNGYELFFGFFDAPVTAVRAVIYCRPHSSGGLGPYCGFFHPMVSVATATQTEPPPFSVNDQSPAINAALAGIDIIISDGIIDRSEKRTEILRWTKAQNERADLVARASAAGVSSTNYSTAYTTLSNYIGTLSNFNDVAQDTAANGVTYRGNWSAYYLEFEALVRAIEAAAASTSTWSGVTGSGKPANNATANPIWYGGTMPAVPFEGMIWVNDTVTPNVSQMYTSGAWRITGKNVTNTNQLTDGAGLGNSSTWTGTTGKPTEFTDGRVAAGINSDGTLVSGKNNLGAIADGGGYSRTIQSRVSGGKPIVDFSETIHFNKNLDNVGDGTTFRRVGSGYADASGRITNVYTSSGPASTQTVYDYASAGKGASDDLTAAPQFDRVNKRINGFYGEGALARKGSVDFATGDVTNRTANNITYTAGGTVDSLKPAEAGAQVTAGKSIDILADGTTYRRTGSGYVDSSGRITNLYTSSGPTSTQTVYDYAAAGNGASADLSASPDFNRTTKRVTSFVNQGGLSIKNSVDLATGEVIGKVATNITYSGGGTVESLKPAQAGADATAGKSIDVLVDGTNFRRTGAGYVDTTGRVTGLYDPAVGIRDGAYIGSAASRATSGLQTDGKLVAGKNDLDLINDSATYGKVRGSTLQSGIPKGMSAGQNTIQNASFESNLLGVALNQWRSSGDLIDGWKVYDASGGSVMVQSGSGAAPRTGSNKLLATIGNSINVPAYGRVESFANTPYEIEVHAGEWWTVQAYVGIYSDVAIPAGLSTRTLVALIYLNASGGYVGETSFDLWNNVGANGMAGVPHIATGQVPTGAAKAEIWIGVAAHNTTGAPISTPASGNVCMPYFDDILVARLSNLDTEVQHGTVYGKTANEDLIDSAGIRRIGLRVAGSNQRIGDQRNLPQSRATSYGVIRNVPTLAATSSGSVSVNAHVANYGSVSINYSAVSNAVTGLTVGKTYVIYASDPDYSGGTRTWQASESANFVMTQGDGIVVAGYVTIPSSGSSGGGGGPIGPPPNEP
ncbi:hypothetical protein V3390_00095 [Luteimonas sp. FXH3W]|uniref:Fibronectin type-III domain-containing protein n=1 Tax=Aquilutibacter rugosus TaxID=3115820 RepID=A0ABU7UVP3_9GAMM